MKKAFSLIELSISLIVIGIIIAAVMSGGDVIQSGETKKFYQSFARKWTTIIDSYKDAMGEHITDGSINAGTAASPDGYFDGIDISTTVINRIKSAGVDPCRVLSISVYDTSGNCDAGKAYVSGAFDTQALITVRLGAHTVNNKTYNFIIFKDVPDDVAGAMDRYVDGMSDGTKGNCLNLDNVTTNLSTITPIAYTGGSGETTDVGIIVEH